MRGVSSGSLVPIKNANQMIEISLATSKNQCNRTGNWFSYYLLFNEHMVRLQ
uniref:Uncharacterized protein n=1 Tax=Arundo donax TaxID=35708 RepID=A0A0A9TNW9_ARUDO